MEFPSDHKRIIEKLNSELKNGKIADNMYFPVSKDLGIYLQQDGF
jgi:maltose phosphorylase